MRDGVERASEMQHQRMCSALLSALAACVTAGVLAWAMLVADSSTSRSWFFWIAILGLPPIVLSLAAAAQYRWGHGAGAGAGAAALYWVFLIVYSVRAADLFLFGALFQTAAWFLSRPRSRRTRTAAAANVGGRSTQHEHD